MANRHRLAVWPSSPAKVLVQPLAPLAGAALVLPDTQNDDGVGIPREDVSVVTMSEAALWVTMAVIMLSWACSPWPCVPLGPLFSALRSRGSRQQGPQIARNL